MFHLDKVVGEPPWSRQVLSLKNLSVHTTKHSNTMLKITIFLETKIDSAIHNTDEKNRKQDAPSDNAPDEKTRDGSAALQE